jgi:hypothetical protein
VGSSPQWGELLPFRGEAPFHRGGQPAAVSSLQIAARAPAVVVAPRRRCDQVVVATRIAAAGEAAAALRRCA